MVRVLLGLKEIPKPDDCADALAAADPPVMVRDYQTDLGYFDLDPCNLHAGEAQIVADQLRRCLAA